MTDTPAKIGQQDGSSGNAKIVYILYLIGLVVGITSIVGVVMAYIYKADAPDWLKDHFRWQIRTFWIGIVYSLIGMVTTLILVGYLILLFVLVWYIVRCVKGLQCLDKRQPLPDSGSWMF
ncbi:putative membrane protein [Marinobacterium halophilum]|uniref:Putative membrane protein n=1 Tax=Marinobacterium halophilum TaxID=267374 RepID=A0A2P8ERW9_9GAMM|nr:hypothetical protein [Marinobacterium halophilum]PSL12175.1 putative membrane protein [Marinobacterium halophilum]